MKCCPTCGGTGEAPDDTAADAEDRELAMRIHCAAIGAVPTWDGYVSQRVAAQLLDRQPKTLSNRRYAGRELPHRKVAGRIQYALKDLATWLVAEE